jgi:hypothetical protein
VSQTATDADVDVVFEDEVLTSHDKDECAHIVMDPDPERDDPHAYTLQARVEGFPVTALCGYVWVPRGSAEGRPVCQECRDIYENDPMGHGDRGDLPDE